MWSAVTNAPPRLRGREREQAMTTAAPTAVRMRWRVETWDPGYGASTDEQLAPRQSKVEPMLDVEVGQGSWRPLDPRPRPRVWSSVLFVDGVRRLDAIGWGDADLPSDGTVSDGSALDGAAGTASMGLFASYAAGAVRCRADGAELLAVEVHRGLFSGWAKVDDVFTSAGRYRGEYESLSVGGPPPAQQLSQAVQRRMRDAEVSVSRSARSRLTDSRDDDLLVVDGPLHDRTHLPRTLGYAKTHDTQYLPAELNRVVGMLSPGQRTPVFGLADRLPRYAWYVRLPGGSSAPWAGVVRVECSAQLPLAEAIITADGSQRMLCRYASSEYKDARAPQNLYPIAGLERELRRRLGDQGLLYRAIRRAAVSTTTR